MRSASRPTWQQVTAVVSLSAGGAITGFTLVPAAPADMVSPTGMPVSLLALEQSASPAAADNAMLRSAIVNVASYYLQMARSRTPAQMEAIIWQHASLDGGDHGASCAAFASLTLELGARVVGQHSWVTGGSSYPWPLHTWADARVDPNPASLAVISILQDAQAHHRWHPLGDGYQPEPGDWVLFDGHVEVVTNYASGLLYTIGGDSAPNFSVNAHEYPAPLAARGVAGFVDNGAVSRSSTATLGSHAHVSRSRGHVSASPGHARTGRQRARHGGGHGRGTDRGAARARLVAIPGSNPAGKAAHAAAPAAGSAAIPGVPAAPRGRANAVAALHRERVNAARREPEDGQAQLVLGQPAVGQPAEGQPSQGHLAQVRPAHSHDWAPGGSDQGGPIGLGAILGGGAHQLDPPDSGGARPPDGAPHAEPRRAATLFGGALAAIPGLPQQAHPFVTGAASALPHHHHHHHAAPLPAPASNANPQQAFINQVAPGALATQRRYGVPAPVTIAQAILESGWGQSGLASRDHNLFGIKGTGPAGTDHQPTVEYVNGQWVTLPASFRVYHNVAESINDHGALLATSGYYQTAMSARGNPNAFANALTGVYATDPQYGAKLIHLMQRYNLYRYGASAPATAPTAAPPGTATPDTPDAPASGSAVPSSAADGGASSAKAALGAATPGTPTSGTRTPGTAERTGAAPGAAEPGAAGQRGVPAGAAADGAGGAAAGRAAGAGGGAADSADPPGAAPGIAAEAAPPLGAAAIPGLAEAAPAPLVTGQKPAPPPRVTTSAGERRGAPHPAPPHNPSVETMSATRAPTLVTGHQGTTANGHTHASARQYRPNLPVSVKNAFIAMAKRPLIRAEPLYRDVASNVGIRWELLAACDWMQCEARPRYSPVHGEKLGTDNPDGTVYRTKSAALKQAALDLAELAHAVYGIELTPQPGLSVSELAKVFAAFRWGGLLKLHHTSAMEFPYSVAGLTSQLTRMRWPNIDDAHTPDKPGGRFRMPFGAVPVVLSLNYPATA